MALDCRFVSIVRCKFKVIFYSLYSPPPLIFVNCTHFCTTFLRNPTTLSTFVIALSPTASRPIASATSAASSMDAHTDTVATSSSTLCLPRCAGTVAGRGLGRVASLVGFHLIILYAYTRARRQSQAPAKKNYLKTTALCKLFASIRTPIHAKTLYLQMT